MDISSLLHCKSTCVCGKPHTVKIKEIIVKEDAVAILPDIVKKYGFKKIFLVSDIHTRKVAGEKVEEILSQTGIPFSGYSFPDAELVADENAVGSLFTHFDPSCDLIMGIGAGTINDICRFFSFRLQKEYVIVGTAPSMDGYASSVSPLIVDDMKVTYEAQPPLAVIGDTNILKDAPLPMIAAGVADVLGKYISLLDWWSANLFIGEYYCEAVAGIVRESVGEMIAQVERIRERRPETIEKIMNALIISGIAISYIGNSRPASGGEHQMAHYWEILFLLSRKPALLHGTKVGISSVGALYILKDLARNRPDFELARKKASDFSFSLWEEKIRKVYGQAADAVLLLEKETGKNSPEKVLARIDGMEAQWGAYEDALDLLPEPAFLIDLLKSMDAPFLPAQVGVAPEEVKHAVCYAKDLRNRFGFLQILFDLCLTDSIFQVLDQNKYI